MSAPARNLDTREKALDINLDAGRYGSFAEIGAGQEVARWFFTVGAAAGTVAKSISAYDMRVSDDIYGQAKRYVSRERLEAMLAHEYRLNCAGLGEQRGETTAFFAFADTVAARSFKGDKECHGWMGIRFQAMPRAAHSQIVLHVRMLDLEALQQQEALGIVGVNLVYAACRLAQDPDAVVASLLDGLSPRRVEIDMIDFSGAAFAEADNRLFTLRLVERGYTRLAMFGADGRAVQPAEALYKKAPLVQRGSFRPPTLRNQDMQRCAERAFAEDLLCLAGGEGAPEILPLLEISKESLLVEGKVDHRDFLLRADLLKAAGHIVLLSSHDAPHLLADSLARLTAAPLGIVLPADRLREVFEEARYKTLDGGILEAFGALFKTRARLYVYPAGEMAGAASGDGGRLLTAATFEPAPPVAALYAFLRARGAIVDLAGADPACLELTTEAALRRIAAGEPSWREMLPAGVAELVADRALFAGGSS